jgi:protein ImuB
MVTAMQDGNRRVIFCADEAAMRCKLRAGMTVAHAQSMVPALIVENCDPVAEEAALSRLAMWCLRYSPVVTPCAPDGIFIDVAGSSHLFKGEAALLKDLLTRLAKAQICAKAGMADTPGCAWAVARYGEGEIVPAGRASDALGSLPVAALRLGDVIIESLRDVGIERIAQLASKPRASLQTRFGSDVLLRLDQALGAVTEVLTPVMPSELPARSA